MLDNEDKILDKEQWKVEAQAIINDVRKHVNTIYVSEKLNSTNNGIFLNLTTLEGLKFCIEVSVVGFTIRGNEHDIVTNMEGEIFETPYSLLDFISPMYRQSFSDDLISKLNKLTEN